jgi:uncharacterized protein (DUF433 family)
MTTRNERRIYQGIDPGEAPAFRIAEAAQFLWVPQKSMRRWAAGETGRRAVIRIADPSHHTLSFLNLAELHVLSFLRDQRVSLQRIRRAVSYLEKELGPECRHPLLAMDLLTDGVHVFVDKLTHGDALVNISQHGQLAMRTLLEAHLKRIERDARTKEVLRLYPFAWPVRSSEDAEQQPRPVTIDPRVAFGRPVLSGTRIPTTEIASRIRAGEPMQDIAQDMHLELRQVEDALRFHIEAA